MAVSIKDNRTIQDEADATTGWTGTAATQTSDIVESSAAVQNALNTSNAAMYHTGTSRNLGTSPGTLVYVWSFNNAIQLAWDNSPPPNALLLGDGSDRIAFDMAGNNRRVFAYNDASVTWQCLVLDTSQAGAMNSAGNTYVVSGTYAGLGFGTIVDFGAHHKTESKALAGGFNVGCDIIRFGNDGIDVQGGTTGARGTFEELEVADRAAGNQQAHGIFRKYTLGSYGCQGPMSFGDNDGTTTTYFEDENAVVTFEDRNIGNDKYYVNVIGNSTGTNHFKLTGVAVLSAGPHIGWDSNGGNVNLMEMDGCVFRNWGDRTIIFSSQADATGHHANDHTFDNCGTITGGDHDMLRMVISNSANSSRAFICGAGDYTDLTLSGYEGTAGTAAILFNETTDPDGELDNLTATKGTAATHVIELGANTPSTITLRGWTVSGYNAANGNNDSVIYNNSAKAITVNVVGNTGTISYRNGTSATTTISSVVDYTLTNIVNPSEVTILDRSVSQESNTSSGTNLSFGNAAASEKAGQSFQVTTAGKSDRVTVRLRKQGTPTDDVRCRLVNGVPGSTELLVSDWLDGSTLTTSYQDITFQMQGKSNLSTATTYGFEIERSGTNDAANYYQVEVQSATYANGAAYLEVSSTWTSQSTDLDFTIWEAPSENELYHVESVTTGTTTWQHNGSARNIEVLVADIVNKQFVLVDSVGGTSKSVPVTQQIDRFYLNP